MTEPTRKLAAILAADVVGYSRLIAEDEARTLDALRALRRELFEPLVAEHRGEVVKRMGDGWLVSFGSVVDAAQCAIQVQERLAGHDRIKLRIGVHLGDIVHEDEDIYGDGVNIAARLQEVAEPGGVLISGTAYESVIGRLDDKFEDAGEQNLKNVSRPIRGWAWYARKSGDLSTEDMSLAHDKPSIAVLPFDSMSANPEDEFFADGMTEDLITMLSQVGSLRVIARNSSFVYKGTAVDIRDVANKLGVRYVLEGSVRRGGNRLRITAQLIDSADSSHAWADRYDRVIEYIFDIQDDITKEIVTALRVKLTDGEIAAIWAHGTRDIEAWRYCVHAHELLNRWNTTDFVEARELAEKAVALDPDYAHAWGIVACTWWIEGRMEFLGGQTDKFARAKTYAERATQLDPMAPMTIQANVAVATSEGRFEDAVDIGERGIAALPGNAETHVVLGFAYVNAGRYGDAVEYYRRGISLNPFAPHWFRFHLARALMLAGELKEAKQLFDELVKAEMIPLMARVCLAYVACRLGNENEAQRLIAEIRASAPRLRCDQLHHFILHKHDPATTQLVQTLRAAGFPE
jgi:adenylate cyclase